MPDGLTEGNEGNKVQTLGGIVECSLALSNGSSNANSLCLRFLLLKLRLPLNQLNGRVDLHLTQSD